MSTRQTFDKRGPQLLGNSRPIAANCHSYPSDMSISEADISLRAMSPTIYGGSVLGLRFKDGAVIAADILGSYGSLARFRNCERLFKVNDSTVIGASGDIADFQYLKGLLEQQVGRDGRITSVLTSQLGGAPSQMDLFCNITFNPGVHMLKHRIAEECLNDGFGFTPQSLHCLLTRLLYSRRSRLAPLWNTIIVAGMEDDRPYTGYVDLIGMAYESHSTACGYGAYLAQPIMREALEKNRELSQEEAVEIIDRCMKLLYYRDAQAFYKYQLAIITRTGVSMRGPIQLQTNWQTAHMVLDYN